VISYHHIVYVVVNCFFFHVRFCCQSSYDYIQMIYDGGVAQLGERLDSLQKVRGSNPLFPTIYHFESSYLYIQIRYVSS